MTVYIEYVLIDNFIIDYCLLKVTFGLTNSPIYRFRLALCSALGGGFALLYPIINLPIVLLTLLKLSFGGLLVSLASKYKSGREYYVNLLVFYAYTFITGGAIIGLSNILSIPLGTESSVAFMVIPVYFTLRALNGVVKYFYKRKETLARVYDLEITAYGVSVKAKGFLDSGNGLYDGDSPVIMCDIEFAKRFFTAQPNKIKIKTLEISTVNGISKNPSFKIDEIKIYDGDKRNIYNNVTLGVSKFSVGDGYDLILHPALIGGNYEQVDIKTEKIS